MPPFKRRPAGCQRCHIVWFPVRDGVLFMGCAHCSKVTSKIFNPVGGDELLALQVQRSQAGHRTFCDRPIR